MKYSSKKSKRWYANAQIGKNVPIIGGTGFSVGTGNRPLTKRSLTSAVKQIVKDQVLLPKMFRSGLQTRSSVVHNGLYTYSILRNLGVGTDEENRIGDTINVKNARLCMQLFSPSGGTTLKIYYRVILCKSKKSAGNNWVSSDLSTTDLFWPSNSNLLIAPMCYNNVSVIYDELHSLQRDVNSRTSKIITINHSIGKYTYSEEFNDQGKYYNYYLVVIPFIENGTTGTTVVGDIDLSTCISFVDSK